MKRTPQKTTRRGRGHARAAASSKLSPRCRRSPAPRAPGVVRGDERVLLALEAADLVPRNSVRAASSAATWPPLTRRSTLTRELRIVYRAWDASSRFRSDASSTLRRRSADAPRPFGRSSATLRRDGAGVRSESGARSRAAPSPSASGGSARHVRSCGARARPRTGADVWLKLENLQRTGSFSCARRRAARGPRHRGGADGKPKRVVAASAGNHGPRRSRSPRRPTASTRRCRSRRRRPEVKRRGHRGAGAKVEVAGATYDEPRRPRAAAPPRPTTGLRVGRSTTPRHRRNGPACSRARSSRSSRTCRPSSWPVGGGGLAAASASRVARRHQRCSAPRPQVNCAMRLVARRGRGTRPTRAAPRSPRGSRAP